MAPLKSNPLLLKNATLTKDQRIAALKALRTGYKNIPDIGAVDIVIEQQLDKFAEFDLEEMNKYRFYSKKTEDTDDIINILDNQLLYIDIMETRIKSTLLKWSNSIKNQKTRALAIIETMKKDKRKAVYDAYKEAEALAIVDKLPPDMVQYIIGFLRPEIRLCVLKEKYCDIAQRVRGMRNGRAHHLRTAIQCAIENSLGRNPSYFTGGKLVNPAYNAVKHIRDTFQPNTHYNPNGYKANDNTITVAYQIHKALENVYSIADYRMKISTDEGEEPSSLSNLPNRDLMNSLIKMYCLVLYATKRRPL